MAKVRVKMTRNDKIIFEKYCKSLNDVDLAAFINQERGSSSGNTRLNIALKVQATRQQRKAA